MTVKKLTFSQVPKKTEKNGGTIFYQLLWPKEKIWSSERNGERMRNYLDLILKNLHNIPVILQ